MDASAIFSVCAERAHRDRPKRVRKAAVEKHGLEGIVWKRIDAPYLSGSRSGWIKVKTTAWREANQGRLEAIRNSLRRW